MSLCVRGVSTLFLTSMCIAGSWLGVWVVISQRCCVVPKDFGLVGPTVCTCFSGYLISGFMDALVSLILGYVFPSRIFVLTDSFLDMYICILSRCDHLCYIWCCFDNGICMPQHTLAVVLLAQFLFWELVFGHQLYGAARLLCSYPFLCVLKSFPILCGFIREYLFML